MDGKLLSAVVGHPIFKLTYVPGEWTTARIGKIFSYENLEDAKFLMGTSGPNSEIWLAETSDDARRYDGMLVSSTFLGAYGVDFWTYGSAPPWALFLPAGDILISSKIRLIERVMDYA
jgi:hypothetical protein